MMNKDVCKSAFWLYITDPGNFGVVHALYHVTLSPGVQNNHSYEICDPYLPIIMPLLCVYDDD